MPSPIIDIEVNDEEFRRFEERFKQMQKSLTVTVGAGGPAGGAPDFKNLLSSFNSHTALLQKIADNTSASAKANRDRTTVAKERASAEKSGFGGGASDTWAGFTRAFIGANFAMELGKKVAEGLKAPFSFMNALSGMGGNLFGLDRLAHAGFAGLRSSTGFGIGYGAMKAGQNVFGATFDPNAVMGGLAAGRSDVASDQFRAMAILGINRGDTGDMMGDMRQKARQFAVATPEHLLGPLMKAYGFDQFFSTQDMRRLKNQSDKDFDKDTSMFQRQRQYAGVDAENLRKWRDFNIALMGASTTIESSLIKGLAPLAPKLEELSKGLSETIAKLLDSKGFREVIDLVARGLEKFASYIARGELVEDLKLLWEEIKNFTAWLRKNFGWLVGPAPTATPTRDAGGMAVVTGRNSVTGAVWDSTGNIIGYQKTEGGQITDKQGNPVDLGLVGGRGSGAGGYVGGSSAMREDIQSMMGKGWSYEQAVGIVANLKDESAGNLYAVGDKGAAFGLAQWHPPRQAKFKELFNKDIRYSTREEQLEFLHQELLTTESDAGRRLRAAKTMEEAAAIVSRYYERPAAADEAARNRAATATSIGREVSRQQVNIVNRVVVENATGADISVTANNVWNAQ